MKAAAREHFPTEASLCEAFVAAIKTHGGWTVYPETAGFDLLCVYDKTGHQLGIEAKLKLNAKVADQILPAEYPGALDLGPDFRAVLVPALTEASHGIARLLRIVGVLVFAPDYRHSFEGVIGGRFRRRHHEYDADPAEALSYGRGIEVFWHDWNPVKRCPLPEYVPQVAAGVPSPLQLTPWKIGALKVIADLELDGFTTARGVRKHGIDPRRFCASDGFLVPLGEGKWGRGNLPLYEQQHPEAYADILFKAKAERESAGATCHLP